MRPDPTIPGPTSPELVAEALRHCESEPIHRIETIQPHGLLFAFDPADGRIVKASDNTGALFGRRAVDLIGQPLARLLGAEQYERLRDMTLDDDWRPRRAFALNLAGRPADALLHRSGDLRVLELEMPARDRFAQFYADTFTPLRDALWSLDGETDLDRYLERVVELTRLLTGHDRVMMYRFDENWDGEVIAEARAPGLGSFLGQRFPAADIPAQARALYRRNPSRLIADTQARPVALVGGDAPLDLTWSELRGVSPVHVEYMHNMGVRASLSISLLRDGQLWGLIACHHHQPRWLPMRERELHEMLGRAVSLKLSDLEHRRRDADRTRIRELLHDLIRELRAQRDLDAVFGARANDIMALARASGVVIAFDRRRLVYGHAPMPAELDRLEDWLRTRIPAEMYHTESLPADFPEAAAWGDLAQGILVAPLEQGRLDYLMWLRPAVDRVVTWGGRLDKQIVSRDGHPRLTPRQSFEIWLEHHKDKSLPWTPLELEAANSFGHAIVEVLTRNALSLSERRYRLLSEHSTDIIAVLDPDLRYRFVSPSIQATLGRSPESLLGQPLADTVVEADRDTCLGMIRRALENDQPVMHIHRLKASDGRTVWCESVFKRVRGETGDEIIVNTRDITQRHTYQLAIEDLHQRHAAILDTAGEGVIGIDDDGDLVFINAHAASRLGYREDALIGRAARDFIQSARLEREWICPAEHTLKYRRTLRGEDLLLRRHDGQTLTAEYICSPIDWSEGHPGALILFREFQGNVGPLEQLRRTEQILDQTSEAIMVTDRHGVITSINRAFREITGYEDDEALGHSTRLLKSGIHTPQFYERMWQTLNSHGNWRGEIWNRRKNGEIFPQWLSINAISDRAGAVTHYVATFSDISRVKEAEEKLHYLATHDNLTGLPNRAHFNEHLTLALERARRGNFRIAVAFVDLDHFKDINDNLGHHIGDQYLLDISRRLRDVTRQQDLLARWGGDEFVLAAEDVPTARQVEEIAERLMRALKAPFSISGYDIQPSASIGIACFPDDAVNLGDLVKCADAAMYRAKDSGRAGYVVHSSAQSEASRHAFSLLFDLRRALADEAIAPVYQPQFDANGHHLTGIEALARWHHPRHGAVPPSEFVPLAERNGLIGDLGDTMLRAVCRDIIAWRDAGLTVPRVAVNISPLQLRPGFAERIERILNDFGLAPSHIELEITEQAIGRSDEMWPVIERLKSLGIRMAVDDFGTGYSALAQLKNLPVERLKIDQSFITGLPGDERDRAIVHAILSLCETLGLECVAEGVETAEQRDFLARSGICSLQGHYLGMPVPAGELATRLSR